MDAHASSRTDQQGQSAGLGLRDARLARRVSQLQLALQVGVSQRHLSYVETGKAQPSRSLLLALMQALGIPLAQRNALLLAAGYAPEFAARSLDSADLAPVRAALQHLLDAHEPAPAVVVDVEWNLVLANQGAVALMQLLGQTAPPPGEHYNVLRRLFDPAGTLRSAVRNFDEVAAATWQRLQQEVLLHPPLAVLMQQLQPWVPPGAVRSARSALDAARPVAPPPVLLTRFATARGELAFFSAFTTFGTPQDITVASLRVEHFFPADAATRALMQDVVASPGAA